MIRRLTLSLALLASPALADDTAAIQAAVNGQSIVNFEPKTYFVNARQGIRIPSDRTLRLNGATIQILPGCVTHCKAFETIPGSQSIRLEGPGTIVGDLTPAVGFSIGFRADSVSGLEISWVTFRDWRTDAWWLGGNLGSHDVRLTKVTVDGFGRNGGSIVNGSGFRLDRYIARRAVQIVAGTNANPGAGVDLEPNPGDQVTGVLILDSYVEDVVVGYYLHAGRGQQNVNVSLINSEARRFSRYGVILNSTRKGYLIGNRMFAEPAIPGQFVPVGISVGGTFIPGQPQILAEDIHILGNRVEGTPRNILAGVKNYYVIGNEWIGGSLLPVIPTAGVPATAGIQVTVP